MSIAPVSKRTPEWFQFFFAEEISRWHLHSGQLIVYLSLRGLCKSELESIDFVIRHLGVIVLNCFVQRGSIGLVVEGVVLEPDGSIAIDGTDEHPEKDASL